MAPVALYEELRVTLAVDYVGVGNLFGAYLIAYALCNIPVGMLADRFDARKLVAVGAALSVAASVVFATATIYPIAIAARIVLGLAGALIYVPSVRFVVANFPKAKRGTVMGLLEMGAGAGQILSLTLLPFLAGQWDLARAFLTLPLIGVLVLGGVFLGLPPSRPIASPNAHGELRLLLRSSRFWDLIAFQFLGMLAIYAISGWLPTFARVDFGYTAVQAGLVGALVNVSLSLFSPLAGVISDRMRSRPPVLLAGALLMAACLAALAISRDPTVLLVTAFLAGVSTAFSIPVFVIYVGESFAAAGAGVAVSIAITIGQVASSLSGPLFGYTLEMTGTFVAVWGLALATGVLRIPFLFGGRQRLAVEAPAAGFSRETRKRIGR
jgi:MFS family permease